MDLIRPGEPRLPRPSGEGISEEPAAGETTNTPENGQAISTSNRVPPPRIHVHPIFNRMRERIAAQREREAQYRLHIAANEQAHSSREPSTPASALGIEAVRERIARRTTQNQQRLDQAARGQTASSARDGDRISRIAEDQGRPVPGAAASGEVETHEPGLEQFLAQISQLTEERIREQIHRYHEQFGAAAQPIHEQHDNIRDFSQAPNLNHEARVDDTESRAAAAAADENLRRAAEEQAGIADDLGGNMAPLVGKKPAPDFIKAALDHVRKSDSEIVRDLAMRFGQENAAVLKNPLDPLVKHIAFTETLPFRDVENAPGLQAFMGPHLRDRMCAVSAAADLYTALAKVYGRPTGWEKVGRFGVAAGLDMLGAGGLATAGTLTHLAAEMGMAAISASDVVCSSMVIRRAVDLNKVGRSKAKSIIKQSALDQGASVPNILLRAATALYSEENQRAIDQRVGGGVGHALQTAARDVRHALRDYLKALHEVDRAALEDVADAFSRAGGEDASVRLVANVEREQTLLRAIGASLV